MNFRSITDEKGLPRHDYELVGHLFDRCGSSVGKGKQGRTGDPSITYGRKDRQGRGNGAPRPKSRHHLRQNEELIEVYKNTKDPKVFERLVINNLGLIHDVAAMYAKSQRHSLTYEDLRQEGVIGLMEAIRRYTGEGDSNLASYARHHIKLRIRRAVYDQGTTVRIPNTTHETIRAVRQEELELEAQGKAIDPERISEALGITLQQYAWAKYVDAHYIKHPSLNKPLAEEDAATLGDMITYEVHGPLGYVQPELRDPAHVVTKRHINVSLRYMVAKHLTPREQRVVRLRFGFDDDEPKTLQQIGGIMGLSSEGVRKVEVRALKKLQRAMKGRKADYSVPDAPVRWA